MEERRKRGRKYSRNEGWNRGGSTVETRVRKEEEEGKGVQQRRGMKKRREKGMNYSKDEG
jgi:hypothetical protein